MNLYSTVTAFLLQLSFDPKRALFPILSGITAFAGSSKKLRNYHKFMKLAQLSTLEEGKAIKESRFNRVLLVSR